MPVTAASRTNQYVLFASKAKQQFNEVLSDDSASAVDHQYFYQQVVITHYQALIFTCYEFTKELHGERFDFSTLTLFKEFITNIPQKYPQFSMLYERVDTVETHLEILLREFENCFTPFSQVDQRFPQVTNDTLIPVVQKSGFDKTELVDKWFQSIQEILQYFRSTQQEY